MISKLPHVSMMKVSDVTEFFVTKNLSLIIEKIDETLNKFVHVEETKPYSENPIYYYDTTELKKHISADTFREMETIVTTRTDEQRWFCKVVYEKQIDYVAVVEQFIKLQESYDNIAKSLEKRAVEEAHNYDYAKAAQTTAYVSIYTTAAKNLNGILNGGKWNEV